MNLSTLPNKISQEEAPHLIPPLNDIAPFPQYTNYGWEKNDNLKLLISDLKLHKQVKS